MRIGHGYDAHRFCENRKMVLGGVELPVSYGLEAHSDGDVLLHALMDALLGAAGERDIGWQFPPSDEAYRNIDSRILLRRVMTLLEQKGFAVEYADLTVVAQKPKLSGSLDAIRQSIAETMDVPVSRVNVKATTEEHMGFTGREEGMAAHAVCLLRE